MARKDVTEESEYHRRGDKSIIVKFGNSSDFTFLFDERFFYQKRLHNNGHLNLATEVSKGFSAGVFNKLCVKL